MKYEVFISYSRKDTKVADRVCKAFDKAGITYFIDREGISGGYEFPVVLAEAIIESRLVLFLGSKNAYESKYTNSELTFAFNEKPKNSILPYIIDGSNMPPALRFVFSSINWRTIESHPIETTLVSDVLNLLGRKPHEVSEEQTASKKRVVPKEPKVDEVKTSNKRVEKEVASQKSLKSVTPLPKNEPSKPRFDWLKSRWKSIVAAIFVALFAVVGVISVVNTLQERIVAEREAEVQVAYETVEQEWFEAEEQLRSTPQNWTAREEAEQERIAAERAAKEKAVKEQAAKEKAAREKAEQERIAAERAAKEQAAKEKAAREKAEQERIAVMVAGGKGRDGVYKIGDYYNRDGKEGVVFEVSSDGRHGKIVSLKGSRLQWSSDRAGQKRLIGVNDEFNGAYNMAKVRAIKGWREKYPAFVWCSDLGKGWYLPAKEELLAIFRNKEAINKTLSTKNGGNLMYSHWSSTESKSEIDYEFCAWYVDMDYGFTLDTGKHNYGYVRAVSAF